MFIINWKLASLVVIILPILILWLMNFANGFSKNIAMSQNNSKLSALTTRISRVRVIKALGREDANLDEFKVLTSGMYNSSYRAAWFSALFLPTVQLISAFAVAAVVWFGGVQAQTGAMTIGGIQAFVSYITFMMWPVQDIARVFSEMQQAIASAERMFSLIDSQQLWLTFLVR
jgi:ATP-binding cassette subfamily B protein